MNGIHRITYLGIWLAWLAFIGHGKRLGSDISAIALVNFVGDAVKRMLQFGAKFISPPFVDVAGVSADQFHNQGLDSSLHMHVSVRIDALKALLGYPLLIQLTPQEAYFKKLLVERHNPFYGNGDAGRYLRR